MGLFDKLFNKDPLADPVIKKYFEIIRGMWYTFSSDDFKKDISNITIRRYVEYFLGEPCNEEKLGKALELFNMSLTDYPRGKTQTILTDFRKSLINSTKYCCNRYEAYRMFRQEELDDATKKYNKVLDTIKDDVNYKHFSQGIEKMECGDTAVDIVIADSFIDGNPITRKLVLEYFIDTLIGRMKSEKYKKLYDINNDIALIALKAIHFEKHGNNKKEYSTITDDDYRNLVLSDPYYKKAVDDHPFEKEEYINKFIKAIKNGTVFCSLHTTFKKYYHINGVDDYFCDAVCNLTWKEITKNKWVNADGEDITNSKNIVDIEIILYTYLENS